MSMRLLPTLLTLLSIVGISLHIVFFIRLKRRFADEWSRLGCPNFLWPTDIRSGGLLMKYVLGGGFSHLPDKTLVMIGQLLRGCELAFIIGFIWSFFL